MSASECLEHKWLSESAQLQKCQSNSNTIEITNKSQTTHFEQNISSDQSLDKTRDNNETATSPPKPSAGFFLHQNPKNGTNIDDMFINNYNSTTINTNLTMTSASKNHNNIDHQLSLPHYQPLSIANGEFCTKDIECLKQNATINNNTNLNCMQNDTNELLKDYATNKENINLSKILVNRMAPLQNQSSTQLNNTKAAVAVTATTTTTTMNNNLTNIIHSSCSTSYEYTDDNNFDVTKTNNSISSSVQQTLNNSSSSSSSTQQQSTTKHETILFPDAPTTPKVSRKSNIESDTNTPPCVALVKQYQLNNGNNNLSIRIDVDSEIVPDSTTSSYTQSPINRNRFSNHSDHTREIPTSYCLSATAITRLVTLSPIIIFTWFFVL